MKKMKFFSNLEMVIVIFWQNYFHENLMIMIDCYCRLCFTIKHDLDNQ